MIRKITTLIIAVIALVSAGEANAQFRYGPTVGVDFTNLHFKQDLFTVDQNTGFSAGVAAEMMFPGIGFGIDFGFMYEKRGAKLHLGEKPMWADRGYGEESADLHYVVIPFHLRYKHTRLNGLEDYFAPLAYVGPSFGFLAGHSKLDAMSYAGGELGIDLGIGAEICRKWQITGGYTFGMTYATKAKILSDMSARNRVWSVKVAYLF